MSCEDQGFTLLSEGCFVCPPILLTANLFANNLSRAGVLEMLR